MPEICPQPGPQTEFLSTPADIAIYGGAAGGGKSYGLLLEGLRNSAVPDFFGVIFRKTLADVKKAGSLWDTSLTLYGSVGGVPMIGSLSWLFGNCGKISFNHLVNDAACIEWQGAQVPLICFDELTHFSEYQFFYMLSRNRSTCGVTPYVRATCNPDADSWVATFIAWWIDQDTGYAIPERSGVIRWMARVNGVIEWADTKEELLERFAHIPPEDLMPKSVTFIAAKLSDNQILMAADPGYRANLLMLQLVERQRLLDGNWKIRATSGTYFKRAWFKVVSAAPAIVRKRVRSWDFAGSEEKGDATACILMSVDADGVFYIEHGDSMRVSPFHVEQAVLNYASQDGKRIDIRIPQDPAQAGKYQAQAFISKLAGWKIKAERETGDKETRAKPFSAQCEGGNVRVVEGAWNNSFFDEIEAFPPATGGHDDWVDAASGAFNHLTEKKKPMQISDAALAAAAQPGTRNR